jgi:hypothetical protein
MKNTRKCSVCAARFNLQINAPWAEIVIQLLDGVGGYDHAAFLRG